MVWIIIPFISSRRVQTKAGPNGPIGPFNPNNDSRPLWFIILNANLLALTALALFLPFWLTSYNSEPIGIVPYPTAVFRNQTWASVASIFMYIGFPMSCISTIIAGLLARFCLFDVEVATHRRWYLITSVAFFITFITLFVPYILFATEVPHFLFLGEGFEVGACPKMALAAACICLFESMVCLLIRVKFCKDPECSPETMTDARNF
ncbi:unnamed protein product [Caenorhabditis brenneri]